MSVKYDNSDKLFRARRVVASTRGVNIELVGEQDQAVLDEYVKLGGRFEGSLGEPVSEEVHSDIPVEVPVETPKAKKPRKSKTPK